MSLLFKILSDVSDTDDKAKEFIKTQLEKSWRKKSPLRAAKCQLQFSTTVPEELEFFVGIVTFAAKPSWIF